MSQQKHGGKYVFDHSENPPVWKFSSSNRNLPSVVVSDEQAIRAHIEASPVLYGMTREEMRANPKLLSGIFEITKTGDAPARRADMVSRAQAMFDTLQRHHGQFAMKNFDNLTSLSNDDDDNDDDDDDDDDVPANRRYLDDNDDYNSDDSDGSIVDDEAEAVAEAKSSLASMIKRNTRAKRTN